MTILRLSVLVGLGAAGGADASRGHFSCTSLGELHPEKTQISTRHPSYAAKRLADLRKGEMSVLDFGAGNGRNSSYLSKSGFKVTSYDPAPNHSLIFPVRSKYSKNRRYDAVLVSFVFNVLPKTEREHLAHELNHLHWKVLVVEIRSRSEIGRAAKAGNWQRHQDGYFSSQSKGTFQVGLSADQLLALPIERGTAEIWKDGGDSTVVVFHRD